LGKVKKTLETFVVLKVSLLNSPKI